MDCQQETHGDAAIGDTFGISIAISGSIVLIGAYFEDGNGSACGAVYFYE